MPVSSAELQEFVAIGIAVGAGFYLVYKLSGWPRRRRSTSPVVLGARLQKALDKTAQQKTESKRPNGA